MNFMYRPVYHNEILCHHGIEGQKWGIRRYQNEDGSLTSEGKMRYGTKNIQKFKASDAKNYKMVHDQVNSANGMDELMQDYAYKLKIQYKTDSNQIPDSMYNEINKTNKTFVKQVKRICGNDYANANKSITDGQLKELKKEYIKARDNIFNVYINYFNSKVKNEYSPSGRKPQILFDDFDLNKITVESKGLLDWRKLTSPNWSALGANNNFGRLVYALSPQQNVNKKYNISKLNITDFANRLAINQYHEYSKDPDFKKEIERFEKNKDAIDLLWL